jgi:cysteine desulfurase
MFWFRRKIYLDNNATTEVDPDVVKTMHRVLKHQFGNPSSLYKISFSSAELLEKSREEIAGAIHAQAEELYFTGSASEANNQVILSAFESRFPSRTTIVSSPIEHPSVLSTLEYLKTKGLKVDYCRVDGHGRIDADDFRKRLDPSCFLACVMFVNNELGTIQDIQTLADIARQRDILFFSDCVQALGKISVDVEALGVDYATFSAHKIHGPKGVGALYARTGAPIFSFIHGGHQERGLRAGTEALHNIAGFATAVKKIPRVGEIATTRSRMREVMERFRTGVQEAVPNCVINTPDRCAVPNTLNVTFPGIQNSFLMASLDFRGISVSAGSACNTPSNDPSHVLTAIGLTEERARESIRFSMSDGSSMRDVRYVLRAINAYVNEKGGSIHMLTPFEFDESMMLNPEIFILDIRHPHERKSLLSMPNAHVAEFWSIEKYLEFLPRHGNITVVCHAGVNSPIIAYYLKRKGYGPISFIMTGMVGWKLAHPDLYVKYAGRNVTHLNRMRME